jgi:hypothetical protein
MENKMKEEPAAIRGPRVVEERRGWLASLAYAKRAGMAAAAMTLLAIALSACALETGPEPVPLDQNPGDNGAPTAFGN